MSKKKKKNYYIKTAEFQKKINVFTEFINIPQVNNDNVDYSRQILFLE